MSVYVRVCPKGPVWYKHIESLRPRYGIEEDLDPGKTGESRVGWTPKKQSDSQVEEPESWKDTPILVDTVVGNQQIQGSGVERLKPLAGWEEITIY